MFFRFSEYIVAVLYNDCKHACVVFLLCFRSGLSAAKERERGTSTLLKHLKCAYAYFFEMEWYPLLHELTSKLISVKLELCFLHLK